MIRTHDHVVITDEHNFYRGRYAIVRHVVGYYSIRIVYVVIPGKNGGADVDMALQDCPTQLRKVNHLGYIY